MLALIGKWLLGTCLGRMLLLAGAVWAWTWIDKQHTLRNALSNWIADIETAELKATVEELKKRNAVLERANAELVIETAAAEAEADQRRREIAEWERANAVNAECRVDDNLLMQLRGRR